MATDRYVILDRDGVINRDSTEFIKSADEWQAIEGSLEAIAHLTRHQYRVIIITNQSGLARGLLTQTALQNIHEKMIHQVEQAGGMIHAIYFCPHGPNDGCLCRKPKSGLFKQCAQDHEFDLTGVPMIGDSVRDLQAAISVHGQPVLVKTGKNEKIPAQLQKYSIPTYQNLYEASCSIVKTSHVP
ncbi:MAG: D-glycero-beta-D-manno-heptose 1,7-bisphosphate 7-phosphatase [Gammaproteobacteria bacterium]|nr:D-glycero-beta-D-manno-heptose 1,7-bisphosphate 7-phosphatase [Gammaproteobacteria bacterium]